MNGTDLIPQILEYSRDNNQGVFLLGGEGDIAHKAQAKLEEKYKGISIVGSRNGFFDFENDQEVVDEIIQSKADILIVGMGIYEKNKIVIFIFDEFNTIFQQFRSIKNVKTNTVIIYFTHKLHLI